MTMKISFSPIAALPGAMPTLVAVKSGETLTINGEVFDLSPIPEGGALPVADEGTPFVGQIERNGGVLHLTLLLEYGPSDPSVPFMPEPIINPPDGLLAIPYPPPLPEPEPEPGENAVQGEDDAA